MLIASSFFPVRSAICLPFYWIGLVLLSSVFACASPEQCSLQSITYAPTAYTIVPPKGLPAMDIPEDNPMTVEGIRLGRHLFYDPILSLDSTISCGSCHKIEHAFTDGQAVSMGVGGTIGRRSSMSLINVGYTPSPPLEHNFMWDGRFKTLEEQAIQPIIDPVEMNNSWDNVEKALMRHPTYPTLFRQAFGIDCNEEITIEMVGKALAQFERTLNSAGSKFDEFTNNIGVSLGSRAEDGMRLFLSDSQGGGSAAFKDAECGHCHSFSSGRALFARNQFSNNGIDSVNTSMDFPDLGLGAITGFEPDNGKFREVTLRNIALTAPYMHDGRFATLEEVMDHYVSGIHPAQNLGSELANAQTLPLLTSDEKEDIIAFLHTLTDTSYLQGHPEWRNPFE